MNAGRARSPLARGFTLVELLVVLLIVGLGIAVVTLTVGDNRSQQLVVDARRFANEMAGTLDGAVFDPLPWGVQIYREGDSDNERITWRWLQFGDKGWQLQTPSELEAGGAFGAGVDAVLVVEGSEREIVPLPRPSVERRREAPPLPDLWLASGEITPFELQLRLDGGDTVAVVRGDALGRIALELTGEREATR